MRLKAKGEGRFSHGWWPGSETEGVSYQPGKHDVRPEDSPSPTAQSGLEHGLFAGGALAMPQQGSLTADYADMTRIETEGGASQLLHGR